MKFEKFLKRAILYFIGQHHSSIHQNSESHESMIDFPTIQFQETPCPACLGILQLIENEPFLEHMFSTIRQSGYKANSYQLTLTIPISLMVRHYQLWYHMQDTFPEVSFFKVSPESGKIADVKEVFKWIMGHTLFVKLKMPFQFEASYEVRLNISHRETILECLKFLPDTNADKFVKQLEKEKRQFLRKETEHGEEVGGSYTGGASPSQALPSGPPRKKHKGPSATDALAKISSKLKILNKRQFIILLTGASKPVCPPISPIKTNSEFEFSFHHNAVYVAGRYCKYSRNVSQSPWVVENSKKTDGSVQELIGEVVYPYFEADSYSFMSSGREDIDVRMLGRGRPFVLELHNPKNPNVDAGTMVKIQKEINSRAPNHCIHVVDLQSVTEEQTNVVRYGEETKKKSYQAVVWTPKELNESDLQGLKNKEEFVVDQLTPVRVLHRRALANRKKTIHKLNCELVNAHYSILELTTQAGTYIKEFVHSDLGRTKPSFCDLIGQEEADILLLDVTEVDVEFPPRLQNEEEPPPASPITDGFDASILVPDLPAPGLSLDD